MKSITKLITLMAIFISVNMGFNTSMKASMTDLPRDMQVEIIAAIAKSGDIDEATKSIRALAVTNKRFNALINEPRTTEILLSILANRFTGGDKFKAALSIGTKGSESYIRGRINDVVKKIKSVQALLDAKESLENIEKQWKSVDAEAILLDNELSDAAQKYPFGSDLYNKYHELHLSIRQPWVRTGDEIFDLKEGIGKQ